MASYEVKYHDLRSGHAQRQVTVWADARGNCVTCSSGAGGAPPLNAWNDAGKQISGAIKLLEWI